MGAHPKVRADASGQPFVTDEGHGIVDAGFGTLADPERVAAVLDAMPGVVEHGLFLGMATHLVVARGDAIEVLERR